MRADKLVPRGGRLPLWSRGDAMPLQDIADRLVADSVPKIGQGTDDPVIAPGAIRLGDADNQRFELLVDRGTAWRRPL